MLCIEHVIRANDPKEAATLLAALSGLPKARIKDAINKGAVWHAQRGRRPQRLRRASRSPAPGDRLQLFYDPAILSRVAPRARLLVRCRYYSVWDKPVGLLVEGSRFGDHATLLRQVEEHFPDARAIHLVHRLDLEASGLLLVAHSPQAAARLSALFRDRAVDKAYRVEVWGDLGAPGRIGRVDRPLDGKAAVTDYVIERVDRDAGTTTLTVNMASGRYHQIRRHFAGLGYPVVGDPKYGERRASPAGGMRLRAIRLSFVDPWTGQSRVFEADC